MENNFEAAYRKALDLAVKQLLVQDIRQICEHAGAVLVKETSTAATLELQYFNTSIRLALPACSFITADGGELHVWDKIVLLHYLCTAQAEPEEHRDVSFKQLKSAALYFTSFQNRCLRPLEKVFGSDTALLVERASLLGGEIVKAGDCAVRLQALPKVPVTIIVWKRDDEFPASANIVFDSAIENYLPAEDIVVLCQRMVLKLLGKG